jgi:hypothetical protein
MDACYYRELAKNIGPVQDYCCDVSLGMTLLDMDEWELEHWAHVLPAHYNHKDVKMTRETKRQKQYKAKAYAAQKKYDRVDRIDFMYIK